MVRTKDHLEFNIFQGFLGFVLMDILKVFSVSLVPKGKSKLMWFSLIITKEEFFYFQKIDLVDSFFQPLKAFLCLWYILKKLSTKKSLLVHTLPENEIIISCNDSSRRAKQE